MTAALAAALCFASCKHSETTNTSGGDMSSSMESKAKIQTATLELDRGVP